MGAARASTPMPKTLAVEVSFITPLPTFLRHLRPKLALHR
jgi:hypothetical protein